MIMDNPKDILRDKMLETVAWSQAEYMRLRQGHPDTISYVWYDRHSKDKRTGLRVTRHARAIVEYK
jgi:hypothetical protein